MRAKKRKLAAVYIACNIFETATIGLIVLGSIWILGLAGSWELGKTTEREFMSSLIKPALLILASSGIYWFSTNMKEAARQRLIRISRRERRKKTQYETYVVG